MEYEISEEVWSDKEVKLSHLKVFCYVTYVHTGDQGRNKLDPKLKKCTFSVYREVEFDYHLWDNENKKIIRCRDVIIYKDKNNTYTRNLEKSDPMYVKMDDVPKTPIFELLVEKNQLKITMINNLTR